MMRKLITGAAVAAALASGIALAAPANAAQGGFTTDSDKMSHSWVKVGRAELDKSGAQAACLSTGIGYFGCDGLANELNRQRSANPRASGYWAERYWEIVGQPQAQNIGRTIKFRSGTW